jgi:hypothetical protein
MQNNITPPAQLTDLEKIFTNVIQFAIGFAGIVLFIMLLIGGFNYLTSGGEAPKVEGAKKTITYALLGIVFIAVSYLILVFISSFTGVDVTKFKISK